MMKLNTILPLVNLARLFVSVEGIYSFAAMPFLLKGCNQTERPLYKLSLVHNESTAVLTGVQNLEIFFITL